MAEPTSPDGENLSNLMAKYIRINGMLRDLEAQKEELKTKVLVVIKLGNIETFEDDDGNLLSYRKQGRTTFDKDKILKFCEETGQEVSFFQKTDYSDVLRIGPRREGGSW